MPALPTAALTYPPLVRVGPAGGGRPGFDAGAVWEIAPALRPVRIAQGSGASGLPYCEFSVDLAEAGSLVVDEAAPVGFGRAVEVWLDNGPAGAGVRNYVPVFAGEIVSQTTRFGSAPDERILRAALLPERFGEALRGPLVVLPPASGASPGDPPPVVVMEGWHLEYNPEIAGQIEPNRHDAKVDHPDDGSVSLAPWRDPGTTIPDSDAEKWEPRSAVRSLIDLVGSGTDAPWVVREETEPNPDPLATSDPDPASDDPVYGGLPELADVRIPPGTYPPQALDAILHPLGLDWTVDLEPASTDPSPTDEPPALTLRLRVYRRGRGEVRVLKMQRPEGDALDLSLTDAGEFEQTLDLAAPPNVVVVRGAPRETEIDVRLYPGWEPGAAEAGRLWIANEDGAYTGTRDGAPEGPVPEPPDWAGIGVTVPRRRRLGDRLARDDDGRRLPPALYWRADDAGTWTEVPPSWTWAVLEDRIGVRFEGDEPPSNLLATPAPQLAIVGAVVGDERIEARVGPTGRGPAAREKVLDLDASHRFRWEETLSGGFDFVLPTESVPPTALVEEIEAFATKVLREEEPAAADLAVTLPGLRTDYAVGDLLDSVEGRNIALSRTSAGDARPQITGFDWRPRESELVTFLEIRQTGGGG
ncbi:hypothetical protein [Alienimonas sp. DA493]|uniref:hypothetical protein n=1 Tax=Alienimonas sp. DA493 TaxID=3373605 RepID=UPI003755063E